MIVDMFAGVGGWDLAARQFGMDPVGIEIMPECIATRERAGLVTLDEDVLTLDPADFDPVEGLIASPPCQTFSIAGSGAGRAALDEVLGAVQRIAEGKPIDLDHLDVRTALVVQPLRWALELEPEWILLEQVPQVLPVWAAYAEVLRDDGYYVTYGNIQCEQYGVPQTRRRAVLLAARWPVAFPAPTHSKFHVRQPGLLDKNVKPWVSMAEALGWGATNRPSMTVMGGGTDTGGAEPFGNQARKGLEREMREGRWVQRSNYAGSSALGRTAEERGRGIRTMEQPSAALTGRPPSWAPEANPQPSSGTTRVSFDEAAVLQTFPRDFPWCGTKNRKYQMIGNAIPPVLAAALIEAVLAGRP